MNDRDEWCTHNDAMVDNYYDCDVEDIEYDDNEYNEDEEYD